jgi:hypothetical protein
MYHKTDRLYNKKWGVFSHYLYSLQNNPQHPASLGSAETSWKECVDKLDVKLLAKQLSDIGAGYFFITLMQGSKFFCAPNDTFNKVSGYKPGEACSLRDIPRELYEALSIYGIDLYLYYTGDGPHIDPVAGPEFGLVYPIPSDTWPPVNNIPEDFLMRWAEVLREYSLRYDKMVNGWWIDGCYSSFGYDEARLKTLADAARAGNPDSLVALNNGVTERVMPYSQSDDFTCGEMIDFVDIPDERFLNGKQWHILAPLGVDKNVYGGWCRPGTRRTGDYMREYVRKVNEHGGVITVDVLLRRDGTIDPEQLEVLSHINR